MIELKTRLAERARDAAPFSDEELADEIVGRRRD
jgi:hypothetical protein